MKSIFQYLLYLGNILKLASISIGKETMNINYKGLPTKIVQSKRLSLLLLHRPI
jgi:hypothetical protein